MSIATSSGTTSNAPNGDAPASSGAAESGQTERLVVYGHDFCSMSRSMKRALDSNHIDYEWRDVETGDPRYQDELKKLARGYLSVPTVVFPDGTVMVEPPSSAVLSKLAASSPANAPEGAPASPAPEQPQRGLLSRLFGK